MEALVEFIAIKYPLIIVGSSCHCVQRLLSPGDNSVLNQYAKSSSKLVVSLNYLQGHIRVNLDRWLALKLSFEKHFPKLTLGSRSSFFTSSKNTLNSSGL